MNKKSLFAILLTSLLIIGCKQNAKQIASSDANADTICTIDDKHWKIAVNNGKGMPNAVYAVAPTVGLMDNYVQNVSMIDGELAFSLSDNKEFAKYLSKDSLTIDSIGAWGNYKVYQISNFYVMHRSILLKYVDGKYRILYTESDHVGSPKTGTTIYGGANGNRPLTNHEIAKELRPTLSNRDGKHILDVKYFVGGNSEYYAHYQWLLDDKTHLPTEIKQ
jgi:hypothetical protein